jgi:Baseplate J-like protein
VSVALTAAELFTPAPSGVGPFGNVPGVPASGTWLAIALTIAKTVQLPTTSWQAGAPERTILAIEAVNFASSDVNISIMAQGGFLQTAASGSVTTTTVDGTTVTIPVTPDPSNAAQNPTGAPGWLDLLTQGTYAVTRLQATAATGPLAIANTRAGTLGPYSAGTYHVANAQTGATYANESTLSIPTSSIAGTGGQVAGVFPGIASTIVSTTTAHGLAPGDIVYLAIPASAGVTGLAATFALVLAVTSATFQVGVGSSGTWTSGGTVYLCTVATMVADAVGPSGNASPSTVTTTVTQNAGVFASNVVGWSGSNWESNAALAARALLSLASRSVGGPSAAYVYFAETAVQFLASESSPPPYVLTNGPVSANESANPQTGIVTTTVASLTPASTSLGQAVTPGVSQLPIAGITNANPCVVTCSGPTTLLAGQSMTVAISDVLGIAGVNGTFLGTYVTANSFSIPVDTTVAGAYTGGGSVEGGDLGQIDALIQRNVVPDGITAVTVSALALPIAIVATVVVPQANVAAYQISVQLQLLAQVQSYAIGGNAPTFAVTYDDIVGALEEAGVLALGAATYVRAVQALSINGQGQGMGVAFPSSQYQAVLATPTITVLGV